MFSFVHSKFVILLVFVFLSFAEEAKEHKCEAYKIGEDFDMQCRNESGLWDKGPVCRETGREITFQFGVDNFIHCAWDIASPERFQFILKLLSRDATWSCRVKIAPGHNLFIPFSIPLWGVAESEHSHITTHLNFVFHADNGKIIGAAAYPVRDRFQYTKVGSALAMHGPVKWFQSHTFRDFSRGFLSSGGLGPSWVVIISWSFLTFCVSLGGFSWYYRFVLKPKILRSVLKKD